MANPRPKSLDEESPFKTNAKPEDKKDEKKPLAEDALKTYGLGPYSASTLKAENKIKEMTKKMEDMCGIREHDTCLGVPSRWDLVPDKQVMKEEQSFVGVSEYDTHGTTIFCVLWDEKDLMCMSDGRTSAVVDNIIYVKTDTSSKFSSMGDDYVVATAGVNYYSSVVIRKLHDQFIHLRPKKPNKEEIKDAIKKVKEDYVENWTKDDCDKNTYDNDLYHGKYPSMVCLYGLDNLHLIAGVPNPEDFTEKELTVNGTNVKIFFQGSGGSFAYDHFLKVIGKAKSETEVLECMRESVAMACLKDHASGGFIRYVCFSRGGEMRFSHQEKGRGHHHHVTKVVSNHFESMKEYTSQILLVFRSGAYTDDLKSEIDFEKRLMERFSGASISVIGVQKYKELTVRKLWCASTQTLADAYTSINGGEFDVLAAGEFDVPAKKQKLMERKVWGKYATKEVFQTLAEDFEVMKECLVEVTQTDPMIDNSVMA